MSGGVGPFSHPAFGEGPPGGAATSPGGFARCCKRLAFWLKGVGNRAWGLWAASRGSWVLVLWDPARWQSWAELRQVLVPTGVCWLGSRKLEELRVEEGRCPYIGGGSSLHLLTHPGLSAFPGQCSPRLAPRARCGAPGPAVSRPVALWAGLAEPHAGRVAGCRTHARGPPGPLCSSALGRPLPQDGVWRGSAWHPAPGSRVTFARRFVCGEQTSGRPSPTCVFVAVKPVTA